MMSHGTKDQSWNQNNAGAATRRSSHGDTYCIDIQCGAQDLNVNLCDICLDIGAQLCMYMCDVTTVTWVGWREHPSKQINAFTPI